MDANPDDPILKASARAAGAESLPPSSTRSHDGYNGVMSAVSTLLEIDQQGVARITGTNVKVIEVVLDKRSHGWSPEEIHFQHPGLSLAQIHAALSYYYENQERLDTEIEQRRKEAEQLAAERVDSPLQRKLHGLKKPR